jgi:hypothetical protein
LGTVRAQPDGRQLVASHARPLFGEERGKLARPAFSIECACDTLIN